MPNQNTVPNQTLNSAFPQGGFVDQMRNTGTYVSPFSQYLPQQSDGYALSSVPEGYGQIGSAPIYGGVQNPQLYGGTQVQSPVYQPPQLTPVHTNQNNQVSNPSIASTNVSSNVNTAEQPLNVDEVVEQTDYQKLSDRIRNVNPDFFTKFELPTEDLAPITSDEELKQIVEQPSGLSDIYSTALEDIRAAQDEYRNLLRQSETEKQIGTQLANLQEQALGYQERYQAGLDAITDKVIPLEAQVGEQAALERQFSRGYQNLINREANLLNRLGLAQQARQSEMQFAQTGISQLQNNLQLQLQAQQIIQQEEESVFNRAMTLRQDAQSVLGTIISSFAGVDFAELDDNLKLQISQVANQAGVPMDLLIQGMKVQKDQLDFQNTLDLIKVQGTSSDVSTLDVAKLAVDIMNESGVDLATAFEAANQLTMGLSLKNERGTGSFMGKTGVMRTDRHNNPTAFTTQIAEQAGLVEGVDYVVGDPFPDNPNLFTAKLLKDPIQTTIDVIDKIGFYTQGGQQRWTHTAIPQSQWLNLSDEAKREVIKDMYRNEGGSGELFGEQAISKQYDNFLSGIMPSSELDLNTRADLELKIGDHFDSITKDLRASNRSIGIIEEGYASALDALKRGASLNAPSQAMLVTFQKMLDPTSVVRESEYARSGEGQSLVNTIYGQYQKLAQGGAGVTINDLKEFYDMSLRLQSIYRDELYDFAALTDKRANDYGLDINNILTPSVISILNQDGEIININDSTELNGLINELGGQEVNNTTQIDYGYSPAYGGYILPSNN